MKLRHYPLFGLLFLIGFTAYHLLWLIAASWEAFRRLTAGALIDARVRYAVAGPSGPRRSFGLRRIHGRGYKASPTPTAHVSGYARRLRLWRLKRRGDVVEVLEIERLGFRDAVAHHLSCILGFGI